LGGLTCIAIYVPKPLQKLPAENRDVESEVQQVLLQKLNDMRYSQPTPARANRPKKKDKLPPGSSLTCLPGKEPLIGMPVDVNVEVETSSADSDSDDDGGNSSIAKASAARAKKARNDYWKDGEDYSSEENEESEDENSEDEKSEDENREDENSEDENSEEREEERVDDPEEEYQPGSFVAAVYDDLWYVGQVLDKNKEKLASKSENYIYISFMQRVGGGGDNFKWPNKPDKLNTLKKDVLFICSVPAPSAGTSTSRNNSFSLSQDEKKKANMLLNKAYYHTFFVFSTRLLYHFYFQEKNFWTVSVCADGWTFLKLNVSAIVP
jgi:archaellum component FlaD/FlaE